ncbi:MAG TPA: hypothetical protein VGV60_14335 [Candidatus Polarisedimenticolia bacterium]|jgi:hypothetical protein|nr:hypothetical protein [Candidatus Polarisedimenticolia bacterium]
MARTRRADYQRSNRIRTLSLDDPEAAAVAASRLLRSRDAPGRQRLGRDLLAVLAAQTGTGVPELVVPDEHQPHRRSGGRIVYSLQGDYRRRAPSPVDPAVARGGRPLGRIRVPNRTPARGDVVRPTAFLNTLLHEFCHHHDAERLGILHSFHTSGFHARLRHLRDQIEAGRGDGLDETPAVDPRRAGRAPDPVRPGRSLGATASPAGTPAPPAGTPAAVRALPLLERLWSIILAR